jgi:hypothetical protein
VDIQAWVWICYFIGQALNIWLRAVAVIQSPLSGITTYRQFFRVQAPLLSLKLFASIMLMLMGSQSPAFSQITDLVGKGAGEYATVGVAGFCGLGIDSALDKVLHILIPGLRTDVPPAPPSPPKP